MQRISVLLRYQQNPRTSLSHLQEAYRHTTYMSASGSISSTILYFFIAGVQGEKESIFNKNNNPLLSKTDTWNQI